MWFCIIKTKISLSVNLIVELVLFNEDKAIINICLLCTKICKDIYSTTKNMSGK